MASRSGIVQNNGQLQQIQPGDFLNDGKVSITIDFGTAPINEKLFNIVDSNCTPTSVIDINQVFKSQTEENSGVPLQIFTDCLTGSFNINAVAVYPEYAVRGQFNLTYKIN